MVAAGGIGGAEGAVWLTLEGSEGQRRRGAELLERVQGEKSFEI
jgi:hypothetical protein